MFKYFGAFALGILLLGCGASEEEQKRAVQNMHEIMWDFTKNNPVPELSDNDIKNGGISFSFDTEGRNVYVELFYLKDIDKIKKIRDTVLATIKKKSVESPVYMRFYSKATEMGKGESHCLSYSSDDCYKQEKIN